MLDAAFLLGGLALLLLGGVWLVKGAVALAERLGVPSLVIGLTVVAFGTSTPELVVNLAAAYRGDASVGFGNVVGSNIANIGLLLGITAMYRVLAVHNTVIVRELPMMVLSTLAVLVLAEDRLLTGREFDRFDRDDGIVLLLLFGVFLYYTLADALRSRNQSFEAVGTETSGVEAVGKASMSMSASIGLVLAGLALLIVGGQGTVVGATGVATALGVPEVVIALTVVAIGTSLPELATCLIAARKGQTDLAIGNIVGSNIYNLLFIFGTTAAISPIDLPAGGIVDLLVMAGFSVALLPLALSGKSLTRPEAGVLLLSYGGYVAWLATRG